MSYGPLEYFVVEFKGNQFKGEIVPALAEVVGNETIRVIDLLFVYKDETGNVTARELDELSPEEFAMFDPLKAEVSTLFPAQDVEKIGGWLDNNCSAMVVLVEHLWAKNLAQAVWNANGRVIAQERIPYDVVQAITSPAPANA